MLFRAALRRRLRLRACCACLSSGTTGSAPRWGVWVTSEPDVGLSEELTRGVAPGGRGLGHDLLSAASEETSREARAEGRVLGVHGPALVAGGLWGARLLDVVSVGDSGERGLVLGLHAKTVTIARIADLASQAPVSTGAPVTLLGASELQAARDRVEGEAKEGRVVDATNALVGAAERVRASLAGSRRPLLRSEQKKSLRWESHIAAVDLFAPLPLGGSLLLQSPIAARRSDAIVALLQRLHAAEEGAGGASAVLAAVGQSSAAQAGRWHEQVARSLGTRAALTTVAAPLTSSPIVRMMAPLVAASIAADRAERLQQRVLLAVDDFAAALQARSEFGRQPNMPTPNSPAAVLAAQAAHVAGGSVTLLAGVNSDGMSAVELSDFCTMFDQRLELQGADSRAGLVDIRTLPLVDAHVHLLPERLRAGSCRLRAAIGQARQTEQQQQLARQFGVLAEQEHGEHALRPGRFLRRMDALVREHGSEDSAEALCARLLHETARWEASLLEGK